jgi:hypothetical protein
MNKRKTPKQRLIENPTIPLETFLTCSVSQDKWKQGMAAFMGRLKNFDVTLEKFHDTVWAIRGRGRPFQWKGEFRFFVYEMPTYRVFVNNTKGICMEVPAQATRDQALDAMGDYLHALGVEEECPLPMSEFIRLANQGIDAVRGKERILDKGEDDLETLKKFVIGYCDGKVWTSDNVPPNMMSAVFMPVMFGALDLPKELLEEIAPLLPPDPGTKESFAETEPVDEPLPPLPAQPKKPKTVEPDPEQIYRLERGAFFNTLIPGESLEAYLADIDAQNAAGDAQYQADLAQCQNDNATTLALREEVAKANARRHADWEDRKKMAQDTRAFDLAEARHSIALWGARQKYWENLGCIWEIADGGSTAGRSINGMPMFFSCRFMSKATLARALAAIDREMDHRKAMVI